MTGLTLKCDCVSFRLKVEVEARDIDARQMGLPWGISEHFTTVTEAEGLPVRVQLSDEKTCEAADSSDETLYPLIHVAVVEALRAEAVRPGAGLNMNTRAANWMESLIPGVKDAFTRNLTDMAFGDRLDEIARNAAGHVTWVLEMHQSGTPLP